MEWTQAAIFFALRYTDDIILGSRIPCPSCLAQMLSEIYRVRVGKSIQVINFGEQFKDRFVQWLDMHVRAAAGGLLTLSPFLKNYDFTRGKVDIKPNNTMLPFWQPPSAIQIAGTLRGAAAALGRDFTRCQCSDSLCLE